MTQTNLKEIMVRRAHSDEVYITNRALGIIRDETSGPKSRRLIGKWYERYRRSKALSFAPTVANDHLGPLRCLALLAIPYSVAVLTPSALDIYKTGQIGLLDGVLALSLTGFFAYVAKRYRRAQRVVKLTRTVLPDSQTST